MLPDQKNELQRRLGEYVNVGITQDGAPRGGVSVPWELTAHAFNMKIPDVYLSPADLSDGEIMEMLQKSHVLGCYIWAPLEDYAFLSCLTELRDVYIQNGDSIRDLEFLRPLTECRMLFLQNAHLQNLDVILEVKQRKPTFLPPFACVGLCNCTVSDLSRFEGESHRFSEFLVWQPTGKDNKERYDCICAGTKRYYEYEE
jgi:hypothetical protein